MSYKVKEVADLVGISVRMLHHYDKIGLLKPESTSPAGYRLYGESDLERLQQILFFKELDFSLNQIKEIIESPGFDKKESLLSHKDILLQKMKRLQRIIETVDKTIDIIEGGNTMNNKEMFKAFDISEIENHKNKYAKETKEKYGNSDAYKECSKKTGSYSKDQWKSVMEKGDSLFKSLASMMNRSPNDAEVQETIELYRQYITDSFYNCTPEIFRGLGELYVADERFTKNIDKHGVGLSKFMRDAMGVYCDNL